MITSSSFVCRECGGTGEAEAGLAFTHCRRCNGSGNEPLLGGADAKPSHYASLKIDPWEYAMANDLNALQFSVVKYVTRYKAKNGLEDLDKAMDSLKRLREYEYGDGK